MVKKILSTLMFELVAPFYDLVIKANLDERILEVLEEKQPTRMLEVGAGTGSTAQIFQNYCDELWLLEPAIRMLKRGKQKVIDANWVHGFVEQMPFPSDSFDLVYAIDSLHHWNHQDDGLREILRILKPDGVFLLVDFDPTSKLGHFIQSMEKFFLMRSRFYTPKEIFVLKKSLGYSIKQINYLDDATYLLVSQKDNQIT